MATAADSRTVSLSTPAKPEYVVLARLALSAVCRLTPLEPDEVADLKLAITEAAAMLVGSGVDDSGDGRMSFDFALEDDRLVVSIQGPPEGAEVREYDDVDERELGREILRATADECEYGEQSVRLVKYLEAGAE